MIVMKVYRDSEGYLSFDKTDKALMTVRSTTMSGCINMLEMLQRMEANQNTNLEDYV
jgi:hypothetical protein